MRNVYNLRDLKAVNLVRNCLFPPLFPYILFKTNKYFKPKG